MRITLTEQEAVDLLSVIDMQIRMGEDDRWTDSMLPSLRAVRDQLDMNEVRESDLMPGGRESS